MAYCSRATRRCRSFVPAACISLRITITDRKVRFYGATAVVTSLANIQATTPDGPMTGDFRYTRVYVRNAQGLWKIVSFEASRVRATRTAPAQR